VPSPPHPQARRQPLPEHSPKSTEEDPAAPQALRAIRESPTYRLAEQDAEFIARADIRGPRLEIEYLKADVILAEQHIDHTIVVYGSTRIPEPGAARRKVEALRASVRTQPGNEELSLHLAAAERILAKSHYYDVAREFGRLVGTEQAIRWGFQANENPPVLHTHDRFGHRLSTPAAILQKCEVDAPGRVS